MLSPMAVKKGKQSVTKATWMSAWEAWASGVDDEANARRHGISIRTLKKKVTEWRRGHEPNQEIVRLLGEEFAPVVAKSAQGVGMEHAEFGAWLKGTQGRERRRLAQNVLELVLFRSGLKLGVAQKKVQRYLQASRDVRYRKRLCNEERGFAQESAVGEYTQDTSKCPDTRLMELEDLMGAGESARI